MVRVTALLIFTACSAAAVFAADIEGAADHPLAGRFEGSEIIKYTHQNFDEYWLIVEQVTAHGGVEKNTRHMQRKEGELTRITYRTPEGASSLGVFRAYQEALAANGLETLFECAGTAGENACSNDHGNKFKYAAPGNRPRNQTFGNAQNDKTRFLAAKKSRPEGDIYVAVHVIQSARTNGIDSERVQVQVDVVEEKPRESKVVVIEADEMAEEIGQSGRVVLYGLYFDTDEITIKPDSRPTLDQIGQLLKDNPDLKLLVVGHTDNQGGFDYNIDLSRGRAASVAEALAADYDIDTSRLKSWGVGYTAPVATNSNEQGRARNRRVELVEQ